EDGTVCGILTDRDIVIRGIAEGMDVNTEAVSELMSDDPVVLSEDATGSDALNVMRESGISRVLVTNNEQKPLGVVTADMILKYLVSELDQLADLSKE